MKRIFTLIILSLSINIFSQVSFKPGVKIGVNLADIQNTVGDSRTGLYAGIFGELKLGGVYALQPEIYYSQQGKKDYDIDYISILIANKFYFLDENIPVYFVIGPGLDIELGGETESYSTSTSTGVTFDADISFVGGFGYDFPFGLGIEARYKQGITDVFQLAEKRLNSVIQLGVVYKFDFSR